MAIECPSCAAPTRNGEESCSACGRSLASLPEDARRDERFHLPTDVRIRKLGPLGEPGKEERTIAHDLSRSGMRLLTSWSDLVAGDQVAIEEVGGGFTTGAIVRHVNRGSDQITRVGIEFLERAPDRLVGTTTGIARPAFSTLRASTQAPAPPPAPAPAPAPKPPPPAPKPPPPAPKPPPPPAVPKASGVRASSPPPPSRSIESVAGEVATARATAKDLVAESKIWEALEVLSKALALAEGSSEAHSIRVQTWETQAKVPRLMRGAQERLEEMARSDPRDVTVHSALGRIFWGAGLSARARVAFKHVLELDPSNREASVALEALNHPTSRKS